MDRVDIAVTLIRTGVGITMLCFGLSHLIRPQAWIVYIPRWIRHISPLAPVEVMRLHSFGNLLLGGLFGSGLVRGVTPWLIAMWWLSILPFALVHDRYIGLRDFAIIMALFAVIVLSAD